MSLPHVNITQIPATPRQAASADLWNSRYFEIDENFAEVQAQVDAVQAQVADAEALHFFMSMAFR